MHAHQRLIEQFYTAFQQRDYAAMIACYHPAVHFRDEVFDLQGKAAGAMWHMLCERGADLQIEYSNVSADDHGGGAQWIARYTFSRSGRKVHNRIAARFEFRDGKIYRHTDAFDFWRWSRQALGPIGVLLGWSGFLRNKTAQTANQALQKFIADHPQYC